MKLRKLSLDGFIDEFKEVTVSSRPRRFCFVLGAGASVSSGIPTAQRLAARWEERLRKRYGSEHEAWKQERGITAENQAEHYSDYYEAVFDIQSDGPAYLEQVMEKASPSGGYAALAYLLCHSVNNMVLTTNFDHLAEDSVTQQQKTLPLVIGHESLAHYISADIKRPVIIKIHRDLLMDPKNRPGEINKLHANWEVHLDKVFRSYHPLFIGYAGNDKSLMEYLHQHRESFQNGTWKAPYWTVYGNRPLQGMAKDFMEAAGGYVIYGVDFDELMILLGDAAGFKMKSPEEAAAETLREHEALARKIEEVLTGRAGGKAAAAGIGSPADAAPEARPGPEAADPGEPERLNNAIGRITGDTDPASSGKRYRSAVSAFYQGDYAQAEALLRQLTQEEPDNARYHQQLGSVLQWRNRHQEAEAEYRRALELEPDNAKYHHSLAVTLHEMKRYEEAEAETRRALELEPDNAEYHHGLGTTLHEMKRYPEAEAEKRRALELEPDNAEYHRSLGVTLREMGRYPESEAEIRRAIRMDPKLAVSHGSLARTLHAQQRWTEAEAEARKAIQMDPNDPDSFETLAKLLRDTGREREAAEAEARAEALRKRQGS